MSPFARGLAVVAAALWTLAFYGLIDLLIDLSIGDQARRDGVYLLSIGWGLLYTVLVPGALLLFAWFGARVLLHQLLVMAVAVLVCGLLAGEPGNAVPSLLLLATTGALALLTRTDLRATLRPVDRLLAVLALVAVVGGLAYAVQMIRAVGASPDDITWGLSHLAMQAAFGVSLAGCAALTALTDAQGSRASALTAGVSALVFGILSVGHPDQTGSWGALGGFAAAAWGVAFVRRARGLVECPPCPSSSASTSAAPRSSRPPSRPAAG